jgi:hypothetical protein
MKRMIYMAVIAVVTGITLMAFVYVQSNQHGTHEISNEDKDQVIEVLDEYMKTFNAKDADAWQTTYHFPHYRLASGKMSVLQKAGELDPNVFLKLKKAGWDHSEWDHRNIIQASETKVHVDTRFSRYKADGTKIGTYESLYVVTKEKGRWGVKLRSSFAE